MKSQGFLLINWNLLLKTEFRSSYFNINGDWGTQRQNDGRQTGHYEPMCVLSQWCPVRNEAL